MANTSDLLLAIRNGRLDRVKTLLDAGVAIDDPSEGEPGLALGMACFLGHVDIVSELVRRGAIANLPDNALPTSPLNMAVRGKHKEVVRTLLELGVQLPPGMACGLTEQEITHAQWLAFRDGRAPESAAKADLETQVEEIVLSGVSGTDTLVLEAEALRKLGESMR
jgi:ankyrin repeat protein